jgi:hypothetical protein
MSLPKRDIRTSVPDEIHKALWVLAEAAQMEISKYVEKLICRHVVREAKTAMMRADEFQRAGISRNSLESTFGEGVEHE